MSGQGNRVAEKKLRRIRVLSDGRPGHENQSVGLALALARRTGATHEVVKLDPRAAVWTRMRASAVAGEGIDVVIAAGHRTHLPLWWAARRFRARSIVIMKPSLPAACFDLSILPRHDLAEGAVDRARRIVTRGALNRVPEELPAKEARGLVLIGGPSKHHGWQGEALAPMVARVIAAEPGLVWTVADSRRTPEGFLTSLDLATAAGRVVKMPHQRTGPGWLPDELARARVVWVTADSVSMVHEALTAGAATGVLPAPPVGDGDGGRPGRAVAGLIAAGLAAAYPDRPRAPEERFHEAGRCADWIVAHWFRTDEGGAR